MGKSGIEFMILVRQRFNLKLLWLPVYYWKMKDICRNVHRLQINWYANLEGICLSKKIEAVAFTQISLPTLRWFFAYMCVFILLYRNKIIRNFYDFINFSFQPIVNIWTSSIWYVTEINVFKLKTHTEGFFP